MTLKKSLKQLRGLYDGASTCSLVTILLSLFILLSACQKNDRLSGSSNQGQPGVSPSPESAPVPSLPVGSAPRSQSGGGGIDGSGGDPVLSSLAEVRTAYDGQIKKLNTRLNRIKWWLDMGPFIFEYQFGQGTFAFVSKLMGIKSLKKSNENLYHQELTKSQLIDALHQKNVKILPQNPPCEARDGVHAGAATGNFAQGEICVSMERLRTLPPKSLKQEIFYLLMHELAHIAGFDEVQSVIVQKFMADNPDVFTSQFDLEFSRAYEVCDPQLLRHEIDFVNENPYWRDKLRWIAKSLMGYEKQPGCGYPKDLIKDWKPRELGYVFADDAERLPIFENFVTQFHGMEFRSDLGGPDKTFMSSSWEHAMTTVPAIFLVTDNFALHDLKARIGSKAHCSPRTLIASVLAAIPDVINPKCTVIENFNKNLPPSERAEYGSEAIVRNRILQQIKILSEGPKAPPIEILPKE